MREQQDESKMSKYQRKLARRAKPIKRSFCDKEFIPARNNKGKAQYCSPVCRKKAQRQKEKEFRAANPEYCAQRAAKRKNRKPEGMSDVRWRIEQRRRANAKYYANFGGQPASGCTKWS